jgi:hypothetical protein
LSASMLGASHYMWHGPETEVPRWTKLNGSVCIRVRSKALLCLDRSRPSVLWEKYSRAGGLAVISQPACQNAGTNVLVPTLTSIKAQHNSPCSFVQPLGQMDANSMWPRKVRRPWASGLNSKFFKLGFHIWNHVKDPDIINSVFIISALAWQWDYGHVYVGAKTAPEKGLTCCERLQWWISSHE